MIKWAWLADESWLTKLTKEFLRVWHWPARSSQRTESLRLYGVNRHGWVHHDSENRDRTKVLYSAWFRLSSRKFLGNGFVRQGRVWRGLKTALKNGRIYLSGSRYYRIIHCLIEWSLVIVTAGSFVCTRVMCLDIISWSCMGRKYAEYFLV